MALWQFPIPPGNNWGQAEYFSKEQRAWGVGEMPAYGCTGVTEYRGNTERVNGRVEDRENGGKGVMESKMEDGRWTM